MSECQVFPLKGRGPITGSLIGHRGAQTGLRLQSKSQQASAPAKVVDMCPMLFWTKVQFTMMPNVTLTIGGLCGGKV